MVPCAGGMAALLLFILIRSNTIWGQCQDVKGLMLLREGGSEPDVRCHRALGRLE